MTRRECFDRVGVFDDELPPMEDIDMWIRIAHHYDLYEVEGKTLAYYWRHDHQITQNQIKVYSGLVKIHAKILRIFKDAPKELITKKLVSNQYILSRLYFEKKMYTQAFEQVSDAFKRFPLLGIIFIEPKDGILTKVSKFIKPYVYLIISFFKRLTVKQQ
jgi:hypothetical protein